MITFTAFFKDAKVYGHFIPSSKNEMKRGHTKRNQYLKILIFHLFCLPPIFCFSQIFHDNQGNAILFYKASANILYDYTGNCKFYYKGDSFGDVNVFNFDGKHCGWYINGTLRDHQGKIMASETNKLLNVTYKMAPMQPLEKIIPLKGVEELAPIKPIWNNQFSSNYILSYNGNPSFYQQQNAPYNKPNDYSAVQKRNPYTLPVDDIVGTVEALNQQYYEEKRRHKQLLSEGYIYYNGNYLTKSEYENIAVAKSNYEKSLGSIVEKLKNNVYIIPKGTKILYGKIFEKNDNSLTPATLHFDKLGRLKRVTFAGGKAIPATKSYIKYEAQFIKMEQYKYWGNKFKNVRLWVIINKK